MFCQEFCEVTNLRRLYEAFGAKCPRRKAIRYRMAKLPLSDKIGVD